MPTETESSAIRHILCPVDASDTSEFALTYAALLARKLGARVTALHVFELPTDIFPDDVLPMREEVEAKLKEAREADLIAMVERCNHGAQMTHHVDSGLPHVVICDRARDLEADLIVMGTHGRKALGRMLLGSVAERVLRTSSVPVMTVRKPGK